MNSLTKIVIWGVASFLPVNVVQSAEIGQQLSPCALTKLNNSQHPLKLDNYSGKVIYLDFWASWCPPCAKSFPFLNEMHQQHQNEGLQIIGINLDEDPADAKKFLNEYSANFTLASDLSKLCAEDLGVPAMPSSYLIDRKGVIRHIHLGFRAGETQVLRDKVRQLLAEPAI